ncbi:MAG: RNA polymerase sigma factor [Myxococcota bacterium]
MRDEVLDIAALYDAHAARVWRMVARLGVPDPGVEDVVQEVFLTAHRRRGEFRGEAAPLTWLLGIALRLAARARRTRRPEVEVSDAYVDPVGSPEEQLERRRALSRLEQVLSQLGDEQREVLVLMDLEQLTAPQVAEVLEVKLNTVYSRLRLARAALARALAPQEVL